MHVQEAAEGKDPLLPLQLARELKFIMARRPRRARLLHGDSRLSRLRYCIALIFMTDGQQTPPYNLPCPWRVATPNFSPNRPLFKSEAGAD